jgi:hypothetical protein
MPGQGVMVDGQSATPLDPTRFLPEIRMRLPTPPLADDSSAETR